MRSRLVQVVFETGELGGLGALTMTVELVLHADGSISGGGVLAGDGIEVPFAATGEHVHTIDTRSRFTKL